MLTDGRRTKSDDNSSPGLKARWAINVAKLIKNSRTSQKKISKEKVMKVIMEFLYTCVIPLLFWWCSFKIWIFTENHKERSKKMFLTLFCQVSFHSVNSFWKNVSWLWEFRLSLWCLMPLSTIFQLYRGRWNVGNYI